VRILELSLRNYRVFEEVDLELPARVIGIFGQNGAGKSTLMEAIQFACYGRARTARDQIRTNGVLTDCAVRLVFEHGGQQYEVRRTIKGKNHQTDAELFVADRQLAAGVTEVDAEMQNLLRMDVQVFRASAFAEQKQLDAFSDVTKGKRKEMVLRLLGIRPVDEARSVARRETREVKQSAERLAVSLPDLAEQEAALDRAREAADVAEARATKAVEALAEAEQRTDAAEKAFEASDRVRERVEKLAVERRGLEEQEELSDAQHRELERRIEEIEAALAELPVLEEEHGRLAGAPKRLSAGEKATDAAADVERLAGELGELPEVDAAAALQELTEAQAALEGAQRAHAQAEGANERARAELIAAQEALERAGEADPSQACPTCGRPLGDDFAEYVAHCRSAVTEAKRVARGASGDLTSATASVKQARARAAEAAGAGEQARRASEARGRLEADLAKARGRLEHLAAPFGGVAPALEALVADADRASELKERLTALRAEGKRLGEAQADLKAAAHTEARQAASRLQGALEQARETAARLGDLRDEARYLERVSVLLDGFRDHLVARIGPELSREAEALFRDLTNREYEDLRIDEDTLAIEIADGERYFPIERFSGSEADLANLALRVAISMHLSRMSGADVGMLVLDEVLASLDVERKDLFVQTMGRLAGRFHQLFVITHAEQVKDQFPASIEVRRVGRRRSQAVLA